jgi:hypothetical protein
MVTHNSTESFLVINEFASTKLSLDRTGNGDRLRIENLETNQWATFDALELASLCAWPEGRRHELLEVDAYSVDDAEGNAK